MQKAARLMESRFEELKAKGYPAALAQKLMETDKPMAFEGEQGSILSQVTVGSSVAKHFTPWTGKPRKPDAKVDPVERMERRAKYIDAEPNEAEYEFFAGVGKELLNKPHIRRNKQQYICSSFPHIHATPDGFLYKNAAEKEAVIEVKECIDFESSGLTRLGEIDGKQQYGLRKGHEWYTQLYVQMMATNLDRGYLAAKISGEWMVAEISLDVVQAERLGRNTLIKYEEVLPRIGEEKKEEVDRLEKKKAGRPRKVRWVRGRNDFRVDGTLTNLDYGPEDDRRAKLVNRDSKLGKRDLEDGGEEVPFPN